MSSLRKSLTGISFFALVAACMLCALGVAPAWAIEGDASLRAESLALAQSDDLASGQDLSGYTGWKTVDGKQRYYEDGELRVGFVTVGSDTYYFDATGAMQVGLKKIDGAKYFFQNNGVMLKNSFKKIKKKRYYFTDDGAMATFGYHKGYIFAYNGVAHKVNAKKTGNREKDAARVAKVIAKCCKGPKGKGKDLKRVGRAAGYVAVFSSMCKYTMKGTVYSTAYGVFIAKKYSCAGSTRALGLVLSKMGYKWKHVNENKYTHQWCKVKMDGKWGYADGQVGWVGYGKHPVARSAR